MADVVFSEKFLAWKMSLIEDDFTLWKSFKNKESYFHRFSLVFSEKYPNAKLVPFSFIHDLSGHYNDGWPVVACFDLMDANRVRIYDFAAPENTPWMNHGYENFDEWRVVAEEESLQYRRELEEKNCG